MKETRTCPKCNAQDIILVKGASSKFGGTIHNIIPTGMWGAFTCVPITRYVCGQCGFSEEWVDSKKDLAKVRQKYS